MTYTEMIQEKKDLEQALRIAQGSDVSLSEVESLMDSIEDITECIMEFEYEINNDPDLAEYYYETEGTMQINFGG